jgi:hypothetical protein
LVRLVPFSAGGSAQYGKFQVVANSFSALTQGIVAIARGQAAGASITSGSAIGTLVFSDNTGGEFAQIACEADAATGTNDYPGRLTFSTTADGASSPTERMRITQNGGVYCNGKTVDAIGTVGIGFSGIGPGNGTFTGSGIALLTVNRKTSDGILVEFYQDESLEGTISVSGTTVSYNGAHLSRWSQISGIDPYNKTVRPEILRGTVMSNLDEMCDWTCGSKPLKAWLPLTTSQLMNSNINSLP